MPLPCTSLRRNLPGTGVGPAVVVVLALCTSPLRAAENLDRGVVVMRTDEGATYVGWRLLISDPEGVAFHVYRQSSEGGPRKRLTTEPLRDRTGFVDREPAAQGATYVILAVVGEEEGEPSKPVGARDRSPGCSYVSIRLRESDAPQKVAVADLDGDGRFDYIIKRPDFNTDPFQHPGYWKRSIDTYKIEAYRSDGTFMWRHDLGWSIEEGIWYSPYVVFDLDGDGKAEVYAKGGEGDPRDPGGQVTSGSEYVLQIDGMTGQVKRRGPWPDRSGYEDYNWNSRNLLGVAYLDGRKPCLIVERGTYSQIKVEALDVYLRPVWKWNSRDEKQKYSGCGMHGMHCVDVDGDGRDEIVLGSAVLDDDGHGLWTNAMHNKAMSHPDVCYVGDINPSHPGLEIFYGFETSQPRDGVCLVDAKTGGILWGFDGPTVHVHNQGMVADITDQHPGQECYAGEKDGSQYWLYTADGKRIGRERIDGLSPHAVFWDTDLQKEVILDNQICDYGAKGIQKVEGKPVTITDCLGDWREEVITSLPGEIRVYTTMIPSQTRRVCLMQDRLYRLDVALVSMGYFYPPQLSRP
jgi:rhamnogalacturonan endolyase